MSLDALNLLKNGEAIVMRNITFAELKKTLESTFSFETAAVILYVAGKGCGRRSAIRLMEQGFKGLELVDALIKVKIAEGWGFFKFPEKLNFDCTVIVEDSFEAKGYGSSDKPVCFFIAGYIGGFLSEMLGADVDANEVSCKAKGDKHCLFKIKRAGIK
jgi:predicted hydrocarbon binding protein